MNVKSMFPSKFVAAQDLCGQAVNVVMAGIKVEKVGSDDEQRPVVYFQGMTKGMVLNRTNARRIEQLYGSETDAWLNEEGHCVMQHLGHILERWPELEPVLADERTRSAWDWDADAERYVEVKRWHKRD